MFMMERRPQLDGYNERRPVKRLKFGTLNMKLKLKFNLNKIIENRNFRVLRQGKVRVRVKVKDQKIIEIEDWSGGFVLKKF